MLITVAKSPTDEAAAARIERFLEGLLPKVEAADGVVGAYHYRDPEFGESVTLIFWRDAASVEAYRTSPLIAEIAEFERSEGLEVQRGLLPVSYPAP